MVLPPFHKDELTVWPSKSRNIVATALGKLFNLGILKALEEKSSDVAINNMVESFFICVDLGFS